MDLQKLETSIAISAQNTATVQLVVIIRSGNTLLEMTTKFGTLKTGNWIRVLE